MIGAALTLSLAVALVIRVVYSYTLLRDVEALHDEVAASRRGDR